MTRKTHKQRITGATAEDLRHERLRLQNLVMHTQAALAEYKIRLSQVLEQLRKIDAEVR